MPFHIDDPFDLLPGEEISRARTPIRNLGERALDLLVTQPGQILQEGIRDIGEGRPFRGVGKSLLSVLAPLAGVQRLVFGDPAAVTTRKLGGSERAAELASLTAEAAGGFGVTGALAKVPGITSSVAANLLGFGQTGRAQTATDLVAENARRISRRRALFQTEERARQARRRRPEPPKTEAAKGAPSVDRMAQDIHAEGVKLIKPVENALGIEPIEEIVRNTWLTKTKAGRQFTESTAEVGRVGFGSQKEIDKVLTELTQGPAVESRFARVTSPKSLVNQFREGVETALRGEKEGTALLDSLRTRLNFLVNKNASGREFMAVVSELDRARPDLVARIQAKSGSNLRAVAEDMFLSPDERALKQLRGVGAEPLTGVQKKSAERLGKFVADQRIEGESVTNLIRKGFGSRTGAVGRLTPEQEVAERGAREARAVLFRRARRTAGEEGVQPAVVAKRLGLSDNDFALAAKEAGEAEFPGGKPSLTQRSAEHIEETITKTLPVEEEALQTTLSVDTIKQIRGAAAKLWTETGFVPDKDIPISVQIARDIFEGRLNVKGFTDEGIDAVKISRSFLATESQAGRALGEVGQLRKEFNTLLIEAKTTQAVDTVIDGAKVIIQQDPKLRGSAVGRFMEALKDPGEFLRQIRDKTLLAPPDPAASLQALRKLDVNAEARGVLSRMNARAQVGLFDLIKKLRKAGTDLDAKKILARMTSEQQTDLRGFIQGLRKTTADTEAEAVLGRLKVSQKAEPKTFLEGLRQPATDVDAESILARMSTRQKDDTFKFIRDVLKADADTEAKAILARIKGGKGDRVAGFLASLRKLDIGADAKNILAKMTPAQREQAFGFISKLSSKFDDEAKAILRVFDPPPTAGEYSWHIFKRWIRIWKGTLVTQPVTAIRNFFNQHVSFGLERVDQIIDGALRQKFKIGPEHADAINQGLEDVIFGLRSLGVANQKKAAEFVKIIPDAETNLFRRISSDIAAKADILPNIPEGKVFGAVEKVTRGAEIALDKALILNRAQEFYFRRAAFHSRAFAYLRRQGVSADDILNGRIPSSKVTDEAVTDWIEHSLKVTWADEPKGAFGKAILEATNTKVGTVLLTPIMPFARFMVASWRFNIERNPMQFLRFLSPKERAKLATGDTEAMVKAITGLGLFAVAVAVRSSDLAGPEFYQFKNPVNGKMIDGRAAAGPFLPMFFMAEMSLRPKRTLTGLKSAVAGLAGVNFRAGAGLFLVDAVDDSIKGIMGATRKGGDTALRLTGEILSGFTTFMGPFKDLVAQFSAEEARLRDTSEAPFTGSFFRNIPFATRGLPGREFPLGLPDPSKESPLVRQLTGLTERTFTAAQEEAARLQLSNRELVTPSSVPEFNRLVNKGVRELAERIIPTVLESKQYQGIKDRRIKKLFFKRIMQELATKVRKAVIERRPDLKDKLDFKRQPDDIEEILEEQGFAP